tara:strand:- start:7320 stop:8336 length:1017 start_codon:yes stop_codon:yes gene_type:complete
MPLQALLVPALLGTAAFGIAKLAGASTKTALFAGLGTFAGGAALGAMNPSMYGSIFGSTSAKAAAGNAAAQKALATSAAAQGAVPATTSSVMAATAQPGTAAFTKSIAGGANAIAGNAGTNLAIQAAAPALTAPATAGPGLLSQAGDFISNLSTAEKIGLGATGASFLANQNQAPAPSARSQMPYSDAEYDQAYAEQRNALQGIGNYAVNQPTPDRGNIFDPTNVLYASKGGIAELKKFKEGGINYLPSKLDHNENDTSNYVRAHGYVEDGTGVGDKDEDTMLAQLADGEFVSRADAILGAGIMSGANPTNMKEMRKKGAAFFYSQQAQLKRVYDLVT